MGSAASRNASRRFFGTSRPVKRATSSSGPMPSARRRAIRSSCEAWGTLDSARHRRRPLDAPLIDRPVRDCVVVGDHPVGDSCDTSERRCGDVLQGVQRTGGLGDEADVLGQHAGNPVGPRRAQRRHARCVDRVLWVDEVGRLDGALSSSARARRGSGADTGRSRAVAADRSRAAARRRPRCDARGGAPRRCGSTAPSPAGRARRAPRRASPRIARCRRRWVGSSPTQGGRGSAPRPSRRSRDGADALDDGRPRGLGRLHRQQAHEERAEYHLRPDRHDGEADRGRVLVRQGAKAVERPADEDGGRTSRGHRRAAGRRARGRARA